jgi:hypothetical protein
MPNLTRQYSTLWHHSSPEVKSCWLWKWMYIGSKHDVMLDSSKSHQVFSSLLRVIPRCIKFVLIYRLTINCFISHSLSITVVALSKTWTVFTRSNAEIVSSNPTQGIEVCVSLFCACVVLRVGSGLAAGWSPVQGVLPTVYSIKKCKSGQDPTKGCRSIDG